MGKWKSLEEFEIELLEDQGFREESKKLETEYIVARLIIASRLARGMSQTDLARAIGTSQSRVSKWERGEELPRLDALQRVAQATGRALRVGLDPVADEDLVGTVTGTGVTDISQARSGKKKSRKSTAKSPGRKASSRKSS